MSGHIRRRGQSSWELKYDVPNADGGGRRTVYRSFKGSKRQAHAELTRLLAQAAEGGHIDPTRLTVGEHLRARFEHWKLSKTISPMTAQRYEELIESNIVPYLGAKIQGRQPRYHITGPRRRYPSSPPQARARTALNDGAGSARRQRSRVSGLGWHALGT
jgi:hypothetical protein